MYKGSIWNTYCECIPVAGCLYDPANPDLTTYTSADGTLNGPHTAREIRGEAGTEWCIEFQGTTWSSISGFYIQWDQTAGNAVYISLTTDVSTPFVVSGAPYHVVHVWPPNVAPTAPPDAAPPDNPDSIPNPPDPEACADIADLCVLLNRALDDIQHIFHALGSATDQRKSLSEDMADRLTSIATGVSSNASQLVTVKDKEDAIKADVEHLFPLVDDDLDASLGCPPADITGKLVAFLPAALAAMNTPLCGLRPHTAYTLGALTEFTANLDLSDVDGILLTLPALTPGDIVAGAQTLYKYGLAAWGTADGLVPLDGSMLEAPTWSTSVLLLAPSALARRVYVHLFGNLTAHYQVVSYT